MYKEIITIDFNYQKYKNLQNIYIRLSMFEKRSLMDTVLVTGGLGYIGSHTCLELVTKGLNVCIIDSLINSSENTFLRINEILRKSNKKLKGNIYFRRGDLK